MTSNVDIMYDAISEVLSDCDRAEADLQERIGSLKAINADLLEALEAIKKEAYQQIRDGTGEANKLAHRIWDTAEAAIAETAPKPVRLGDEGEG